MSEENDKKSWQLQHITQVEFDLKTFSMPQCLDSLLIEDAIPIWQ
jgi:hypothetical protein